MNVKNISLISVISVLFLLLTGCTQLTQNQQMSSDMILPPETFDTDSSSTSYEELLTLFAERYEKSPADITIVLQRETADYIRGNVSYAGEQQNELFLAAYFEGSWELVHDGAEPISCTDILTYYEFPQEMLPECYDI